jgi:hypothetical protein
MYMIYFALGSLAIFVAFSPLVPLPVFIRLLMMFPVGLTTFGVSLSLLYV